MGRKDVVSAGDKIEGKQKMPWASKIAPWPTVEGMKVIGYESLEEFYRDYPVDVEKQKAEVKAAKEEARAKQEEAAEALRAENADKAAAALAGEDVSGVSKEL